MNVLGAILMESWKMDDIVEILPEPECFYQPSHQEIYSLMIRMHENGLFLEMGMIVSELERSGKLEQIGGPFVLANIANSVTSSANVKNHALVIREKWMKRELSKLAGKIYSESFEDESDVFSLIDELSAGVDKVASNSIFNDSKQVIEVLPSTLEKMEELRKRTDEMTGVPSGYHQLDKITNGWQESDLIILAARPSVGKTALALNFAFNASESIPVLFFSLEMSTEQLVKRLMSISAKIPLNEIRSPRTMGHYNWQKLTTDPILQLRHLYIDDTASISLAQIRAKARRRLKLVKAKNKNNAPSHLPEMLIIIDYLQLIEEKSERGNREQQISKISRGLKKLAKDLEVPIIALSQLNRAVENRSDNKPNLSDMRESGAIEQDADMVIFTYRPSRIEIDGNQSQGIEPNPALEHANWLSIDKHRNGDLDTILFHKDLSIQTFSEEPIKSAFNNQASFDPKAGIRQNYDSDDASLKIDNLFLNKPKWNDNDVPF